MKIAIGIGISLCLVVIVVSRALFAEPAAIKVSNEVNTERIRENEKLQQIAESALGPREGTVVIIDVQTGGVRAVVNPRMAFQTAHPPGSTIKPFTTLAALRAGVIDANSRTLCREHYQHEDVTAVCSHERNLKPLNPTEAIAYSCNYYFATVGERLEENDLISILEDFGFGRPTGINNPEEAAGTLLRKDWQPENAIGEGRTLQVTPIQLLTAYTALANGGHLLQPSIGANVNARVRSELNLTDDEREIIVEGMRGAVRYGTAEKVDLDSLPAYVVGKTGTSRPLQGFRFNGWFVGLSFTPNTNADAANAQLGVVVFLKNAHGSDAAEVARPIFEAFSPGKTPVNPARDTTQIAVRQVSENITQRMPLDDYIERVVATEGSVEDQPEALKALAIAARTYAFKNLKRHAEEGFDFCSTTHCQRFEISEIRPAVTAAVNATAGIVLRDAQGQVADSYFGASCGGMTSNMKTLWGADAPEYLQGVRDDFCHSEPHSRWIDRIEADRMLKALRSDPRTNVGETIRNLEVVRQDGTGRAELVSIAGDQRRTINGWEFKLIVGRALGWNVLKSSRFTISRSGSAFVFRGTGFGHGLGLCQEGAHVMAQRGYTHRQILGKYFPGTSLGSPATQSRVLRSEHFQITFPRKTDANQIQPLLSLLESARTQIARRAGVDVNFPQVEIVFNETTGDFTGRTGMPPWAAAATRNNRIELQPLALLKKRRILETTLRHELVHVLIDSLGGGKSPRWFTEGLALYVAGDGAMLPRVPGNESLNPETLEQKLASVRTAAEMQSAYSAAYNAVRQLVRIEGENRVWKRVVERNYSVSSVLR